MKTSLPHHVYILYYKEIPIYVGIGTNNCTRPKQHLRDHINNRKFGNIPIDKIYYLVESEYNTLQEAATRERRIILMFGRKDIKTGVLFNRSAGGETGGGGGYSIEANYNNFSVDVLGIEQLKKTKYKNVKELARCISKEFDILEDSIRRELNKVLEQTGNGHYRGIDIRRI